MRIFKNVDLKYSFRKLNKKSALSHGQLSDALLVFLYFDNIFVFLQSFKFSVKIWTLIIMMNGEKTEKKEQEKYKGKEE